jgi:hypothetical protein
MPCILQIIEAALQRSRKGDAGGRGPPKDNRRLFNAHLIRCGQLAKMMVPKDRILAFSVHADLPLSCPANEGREGWRIHIAREYIKKTTTVWATCQFNALGTEFFHAFDL